MSPFGAYNMAGNVAEWTLNDSSDGFLATGGAWAIRPIRFAVRRTARLLQLPRSSGFDAPRLAAPTSGDQGGFRIELAQEVPVFKAASPQEFATLAAAYRYDKTPLDARIEQTPDTPAWKRERITFNGANGARAIAYLYLPRTRRGRSRSSTLSRPAMWPAGFDRCPTPWTIASRRSSGPGAPHLAWCSRAMSSA